MSWRSMRVDCRSGFPGDARGGHHVPGAHTRGDNEIDEESHYIGQVFQVPRNHPFNRHRGARNIRSVARYRMRGAPPVVASVPVSLMSSEGERL